MHDHAEIDTERMILRPLALEHAQPLHSIYADTEAMRYWHEPPHEDLGATRAMLRALVSGSERAWVLCLREGGDAIGLGYYLGNAGAPGMGYILDPRHWRRGLMWEVVPFGHARQRREMENTGQLRSRSPPPRRPTASMEGITARAPFIAPSA